MKQNFFTRIPIKVSICIVIAVLFIFGQLMGSYAIRTMFIQYNVNDLKPIAEEMARTIASGKQDFRMNQLSMVKVYDTDGNELLLRAKTAPDSKNINPALKKLIPAVIASGTYHSFGKIGSLSSKSIIIGTTIKKNGRITGVLFLLKPASDYQSVLNGFTLVFTITLAIGTVFILFFLMLYRKESHNFEQMRRNYIANISHELKSPISSIKALSETLSDGMVTDCETQHRYFGIIRHESGRLEKLIAEMLELSRLQSGKTVFQKGKTDPSSIMDIIAEKYNILAEDIGIQFQISGQAGSLPLLYTNPERILQILNILIDNAFKFVSENGLVQIDAEVTKNQVIFSVKDNGPGIEPAILPYVFERFFKKDKARQTAGSGLGLSIAKELTEGLGEKIWAESALGTYSVFYFTVKRA